MEPNYPISDSANRGGVQKSDNFVDVVCVWSLGVQLLLALLPLLEDGVDRQGAAHPLDEARAGPERHHGVVPGVVVAAVAGLPHHDVGDLEELHDLLVEVQILR